MPRWGRTLGDASCVRTRPAIIRVDPRTAKDRSSTRQYTNNIEYVYGMQKEFMDGYSRSDLYQSFKALDGGVAVKFPFKQGAIGTAVDEAAVDNEGRAYLYRMIELRTDGLKFRVLGAIKGHTLPDGFPQSVESSLAWTKSQVQAQEKDGVVHLNSKELTPIDDALHRFQGASPFLKSPD
ncbi:hypothetical protein B0O99DRAFT_693971 [Bisporella sp. PMI_857]|nr:hypothetical protein B0O99DRAFT_693971 [Bisporella sp. PMI_857]